MKKLIFITIFLGFFTTVYAESVCNLSGERVERAPLLFSTYHYYKFCTYTCPNGKSYEQQYDVTNTKITCPSFIRVQ